MSNYCSGISLALIVVLFILIIIFGASFIEGGHSLAQNELGQL